MVKDLVSIVIPSRNEPYLKQTVEDLLAKATGEIEIYVILDGAWIPANEISEDPRVNYIHFTNARGMRNGINSGVAVARGEFIMKTDAHCMFKPGYDEALRKDCKDNWVVVPRRFALDVEKWDIEERTDKKYPMDYMYLSKDLNGHPWKAKNLDMELRKEEISDLMSAQGSCWFMKKDYFGKLELLDEETYGTFWQEFQEIGLKCWLSGGRVVRNKKTWYAHWHKPKTRGYKLPGGEKEQTRKMIEKWRDGKAWHAQHHHLVWLVKKFAPVPTW